MSKSPATDRHHGGPGSSQENAKKPELSAPKTGSGGHANNPPPPAPPPTPTTPKSPAAAANKTATTPTIPTPNAKVWPGTRRVRWRGEGRIRG